MNNITILAVNGHFEAYNENGAFILSGDTRKECLDDLAEMFPM